MRGFQLQISPVQRPVCEPLERRGLFASVISFAMPESVGVAGAAGPLYAGDFFGGGGSTDLAVASSGGAQILDGDGSGHFTAGQTIGLPADPAAGKPFLVGDFRGNGTSDIVLLSQSGITGDGLITFEKGTGQGTFISGSTSTIDNEGAGFEPITAAVGDFNGDGSADLAVLGKPVTGSGLVLAIMLSNGDGTFTEKADYPVAGAATSGTPLDEPLIANNFAGSDVDLALDDGSSGHLDLFLGEGDGTFDAQAPVPLTATLMVATQLTSSGHLDLLTASGFSVTPLLGNGDGSFTTEASVAFSATVTALASADIDLDGNRDVVTNAGIVLGTGNGTFSSTVIPLPATLTSGGTVSNTLLAADVTGDGRPDVVGFGSGGSIVTLVNTTASATATSVASSVNPSSPGADVTFTATVSTALTSPIPTGPVSFFDGTTLLGTANVGTGGKATFDAGTGLALGPHAITADYGGNDLFAPSDSAAYTQTVLAPTVTTLATSENPTDVGDPITLTATVTGNDGQGDLPSGAVEFDNGTTLLGEVDVNANGVATLSNVALPTGAVASIAAVYQGDTNFAGSTSAVIAETVNVAPLLPVVASSTVPATVVAGVVIRRGSARVTLTNQTLSAIVGPVQIGLFVSASGYIDALATAVTTLTRRISVKPGVSATIVVPVSLLPESLAAGSYTLLARASFGTGVQTVANTGYGTQGPSVQVNAADPAVSAMLSTRGLASSVVSGTATRAVALVRLTNSGNVTIQGPVTLALSFSTTAGATGTAVTTVTKKLALKVGGKIALTVPIGKLPAMSEGMYFLVVAVSGAGISAATTASTSAPIELSPSNLVIQASVGAVSGRFQAGRRDSIIVLLTDNGNVPATGSATFSVDLTPAEGGVLTVVYSGVRLVVIPVRGSKAFSLAFSIPASLLDGDYLPVFSVEIGKTAASATGTTQLVLS